MPGEKSLALQEYYAHPQNKFWKIIAHISKNDIPFTYSEKLSLLDKNNIAVWDIVKQATRVGSLDTAIKNEMPNDLINFLLEHQNIKTICFNGKKAESLFNKYFDKEINFKYISLPSTSPANAGKSYENILLEWMQIVT